MTKEDFKAVVTLIPLMLIGLIVFIAAFCVAWKEMTILAVIIGIFPSINWCAGKFYDRYLKEPKE